MSQGKTNKVHLHNYSCDGKIIQAIMKQNKAWPYEVDGLKSKTFFLHLAMFQRENGMEPTGYIMAGSKAEDQLFALADGKHRHLRGYSHLGEAFVDNDLRFGHPSVPDKWLVPDADKGKIVKIINELGVTFDFPDIELKDREVELTSGGKVVFELVMSIKWWLQKDGSITSDYPLSVHHRLNSAFTNAGFKVIKASPKGVKVESISKYEANDEKWILSDNPCIALHMKIIDNLETQVARYRDLQENKKLMVSNFIELEKQNEIANEAIEDLKDSFARDVWNQLKSTFIKMDHKQAPFKTSKNAGKLGNLNTDETIGKVIKKIIGFLMTIVDAGDAALEIDKLDTIISNANIVHKNLIVLRKRYWGEIEKANKQLLETHKKLEQTKCFPPSSDVYNKYGRMIGDLM